MDTTTNALNWFEIPALDLGRAKKFYEGVFNLQMMEWPEMMGMKMAGFPYDPGSGKLSGGIAQSDMHKPSADGVAIYMNANPSIQDVLDRVEPAGGKIVMPKTQISPEIGYMAFFIDSEGNKIGLHASN